MILTRKSHNCTGTAFAQGDSAGGSKLIEQTLPEVPTNFRMSTILVIMIKSVSFLVCKCLFDHANPRGHLVI